MESFDICGLPLPLWNHFSLAGVEEAASGRSKVKAKVFRGFESSGVRLWIWTRSPSPPPQCDILEKCANWPLYSRDLFLSLLLLPQVVYFTEMHKIFSELTEQIDQAGLTDEQRERETEAKLSELRALSIVADD